MNTLKALESYLLFAAAVKKYSPTTIKSHRSHLWQFFQYSQPTMVDDITLELIDEFFAYLSRNTKLNTQASYADSLRSFVTYLNRSGWKGVEAKHIIIPRRKSVTVRVVTAQEVNTMLEYVRKPRDRIILLLFFTTGIRISELCNIKVEDIDGNTITVTRKGGFIDKVNVSPALMDYMHLYMALEIISEGYVFTSQQGERLSQGTIRSMLDAVTKRADLPHANPHAFRHGFGSYLADEGADILSIMEMMGHKNPIVAKRYIHMRQEARKKRHDMFAPKILSTNDLTNDTTSAKIPSEFWNEP